MDFARAQLEKYGWKEGEGLGAQKTGISQAIKPSLKRDRMGLGADPGKEFTNTWWNQAFDEAAKKVKISVKEDTVVVKTIKKKKKKEKKVEPVKSTKKVYGNFVKSAVLEDNKEVESTDKRINNPVEESKDDVLKTPLTDEQLFAACGGRTAHKAARHGHKLSGKLARLQKHDESYQLLAKTKV
ncbi:G patch domain-containing protein 4 [Cloeon dipterum]|uniref:G patch domain-containing protein 4 n=1 Tax=Cloeon dipterum TaxID=197152 RepID=UPI00321FCC32